ncbi:hypothetical protein Lalb_Chr07g0179171 [Lupinus albus]|uniref:Uncharacterized protein n=1 Tax=Lupinus albus TaxID=3870 RepID=A0A6A4Q7Y4_LUPAL|nr:hypothetical protein Lalb_Chr07g0179171 [Lupinus albus]
MITNISLLSHTEIVASWSNLQTYESSGAIGIVIFSHDTHSNCMAV